jgi:hypothetical protein
MRVQRAVGRAYDPSHLLSYHFWIVLHTFAVLRDREGARQPVVRCLEPPQQLRDVTIERDADLNTSVVVPVFYALRTAHERVLMLARCPRIFCG